MNCVVLIGRLTKDPDMRYAGETAVANFTLAVDRQTRSGEEKKADFPRVTIFGKQAEFAEKYLGKGQRIAVQGRIQTGSYTDRTGKTVYTTDVIGEKVEVIDWNEKNAKNENQSAPRGNDIPEGFAAVEDEEMPF